MDLTLVPFGYSLSEEQLVDVHQVSSGKRCGCECPSCRAPLIARKGNKKIWHFAHDSKSRAKKTIGSCRYSFYVSVRMMARQLIGNRLSIRLPRCEVTLSDKAPLSGEFIHVSELVTESREIVLSDVTADTNLGPGKVDMCGFIEGYCLAFVFSHPGREDFAHFANPGEEKAGVVAISLTGLNDRFKELDVSKRSYREVLEAYISQDMPSKSWIYHPRLLAAQQQARSRLNKKLADSKPRYQKRSAEILSRPDFDARLFARLESARKIRKQEKRYEFICRLCHSTWSGVGESQASCEKCSSSLLVSRKEIPDGET